MEPNQKGTGILMLDTKIMDYDDFIRVLLHAGFSMGGGNTEGIFAVVPWGWNAPSPYETPVRWHTGEIETDPWEWRMRVLDERSDIAYGKIFFKKSGFITREWAPYFLAVRRRNLSFDEMYAEGMMSHNAKRIYDITSEYGALPVHAIKQLAGFGKEEKSQFDRALTELQMQMHLTMCGRQRKLSQKGEEYGWSSTMLCTVEEYWGEELCLQAAQINREDAVEKIYEQIRYLNESVQEKKALKFIKGDFA